jgi:flagellar hook-associated protein 1 FlgK
VSNLFTSLSSASRALDAHRYGLDVAGQNIANVNTPGYSRRTLDLEAIAPDGAGTAGRGVNVTGIRALRDRLLETRLQQEVPAEQREIAMAKTLSVVEAAIGDPGSSIDTSLKNFFDSFSRLAESPVSSNARQDVLLQADGLADAFRNMAERLTTARRDADRQVRSSAEEVNVLTDQIRSLNATIAAAPSVESSLHLRDEQYQLVRKLAEIVDLQVLDREEGGVDITVGNGRPLVIGETSYAVSVTNIAGTGYAALNINGTTVTSEITGGRLGGLLQVRDVNIPDYVVRLDDLAYEVANQVNTVHTAGFDQTGAAAGDLFAFSTPPVGTVGAAAALIVDTAVAADARLIAAAGIANGGDNQNARTIAGLRERPVLNGNTTTLSDAWGQLVYRVGRDTKAADDESRSRKEIVRQVDALRDEVSGVSLDEEAMHLLKFQRAYEANARFFSLIDQTIGMLMATMGRTG